MSTKLERDLKTFLEIKHLKELIRRYQICWEVYPRFEASPDGKKTQVGFEIALFGSHVQPDRAPEPACAEQTGVHRALYEVARWIFPRDYRDTTYEVWIVCDVISLTPQRFNGQDSTLIIEFMCKNGFQNPMNDCEELCVNEIQEEFRELGLQKGLWK